MKGWEEVISLDPARREECLIGAWAECPTRSLDYCPERSVLIELLDRGIIVVLLTVGGTRVTRVRLGGGIPRQRDGKSRKSRVGGCGWTRLP